ncbi:uncharacterized protein LOC110740316 [Chenopodium quinoa]|uniref:uncharacterized protein LOC110740316 n=1 Tax=Chenopodium quinoa TaxID=63459 RepID=UPI000B76E9A8|nr:uncharacterized protein LOC110740316 [Chenopodium quinoa]
MFAQGLDQTAINWIKQGKEDVMEAGPSSVDNFEYGTVFKSSPLLRSGSNYMSPKTLPPLKFHSGLLGKHSTSTFDLCESDEQTVSNDSDEESVASAPYDMDGYFSENFDQEFSSCNGIKDFEKPILHDNDEETTDLQASTNLRSKQPVPLINRGSSNIDLRVELPKTTKRFSDMVLEKQEEHYMTPDSCHHPRNNVYPDTSFNFNRHNDVGDLGTPSAPPVNAVGEEVHEPKDEKKYMTVMDGTMDGFTSNGLYMPGVGDCYDESKPIISEVTSETLEYNGLTEKVNHSTTSVKEEMLTPHFLPEIMDPPPCYDTSGQHAFQTLVAYDACIRLCLHAWAKGCPDAPEFLRDECLILRTAFGLNKILLHPLGMQTEKGGDCKTAEETCSRKPNKVLRKIRVEVKKLRIIPRKKLKSTFSQRGALYMQTGTEYVRHVSSLVKTSINSVMNSSLSLTREEPLSCIFFLKSSVEDAQIDSGSAVCLHSGTGEYHDFFPESQGDVLHIEVRDTKQMTLGHASIPLSVLAENPSDKVRWWPIYHDDHECIGKIQLFMANLITDEEGRHTKSSAVVEILAYDMLLEAAMPAQHFHSRNLCLNGPWKWLLNEFADYYGVPDSYTKLRYLLYVMKVATPTKECLELVLDLLMPVIKARGEKRLNRQEKTIFLECETQVESLLATVFENYKSLDEQSATGLTDSLTPVPETASPALAPAVQVYSLLHDILSQDAQAVLQRHLQTAAQKRCRRHMLEADEFMSSNSENILTDPISISTAYMKIKNLCINIGKEILADIKIHNQHILPSSIDLSNITATVYTSEMSKRLKGFLAACPPSGPLPHVNELLAAISDFERDLETWKVSPIQGGVDCKDLFHNYIMVWVQEMQLEMLDLCKAEKTPWSGVATHLSTSPFTEGMYSRIKNALTQYEMVISRWPQYSLVLENAVADIERAILKSLEKQCSDTLAPLKDSIPKKLGMQVHKLARRQSVIIYVVPNQLGTFINTVKRMVEVLHSQVEDILKFWASCLPTIGGEKLSYGEQMNGIIVLLKTKYKNYMQALVTKLYSNMQANRNTQLKRILEVTADSDSEPEVRERMLMLNSQLIDSIANLHDVFPSQIFVALCRGLWDRMGQSVLRFLEGRKENRVWYKGSYYALGILDDVFASQMQRLQGNCLQEKDLEPPRSVVEARSMLCSDGTNGTNQSNYFYI